MQRGIHIGATGSLVVALLLCGACGQEDEAPKYDTIRGTAKSINVNTNEVSMNWYNPNKQKEVIVPGIVTDRTEIFINGVVARLDEIQVNEEVEVTGQIAKESGSRKLIATRIEVTRRSTTTSAAATAPA